MRAFLQHRIMGIALLLILLELCSSFTTPFSRSNAGQSAGRRIGESSPCHHDEHLYQRVPSRPVGRSCSTGNIQWSIYSLPSEHECYQTSASDEEFASSSARRNLLLSQSSTLIAAAALSVLPTVAKASTAIQGSSKEQSSTESTDNLPVVTNKVQLNIRISRPDGSFYVRDDADEPELDRVFYCRLVLGLYGQDVPNHVQRFLSYCIGTEQQLAASVGSDDGAVMSYASSMITGLDPATGLLRAGVIPSLRVTLAVAGSTTALEYHGRLVPASLWLDAVPKADGSGAPQQQRQPLTHVGKGLLTHTRLDVTPTFGITTRSDTRELDATHQVFGRILFDESEGAYEFLERVRDLPTYSLERPIPADDDDDTPVEAVADAVFAAQRTFFRGLAKNVGDTRLDKVYPGKFLRRLEVTQVSTLK